MKILNQECVKSSSASTSMLMKLLYELKDVSNWPTLNWISTVGFSNGHVQKNYTKTNEVDQLNDWSITWSECFKSEIGCWTQGGSSSCFSLLVGKLANMCSIFSELETLTLQAQLGRGGDYFDLDFYLSVCLYQYVSVCLSYLFRNLNVTDTTPKGRGLIFTSISTCLSVLLSVFVSLSVLSVFLSITILKRQWTARKSQWEGCNEDLAWTQKKYFGL